jgi:1,4-dihydroxy-2-naphthoate octaprenyltransferase
VAALGLAIHLAWRLDRWALPVAVALGLFIAYAYSVEPLRLKGRGVAQLAFYWLGLFTGPMLFTALLFTPWPSLEVIAVCVFFGLMQTGAILLNTAEDCTEDRQMRVRTVIVALGLNRGLTAARMFVAVGAVGLLAALAALYFAKTVRPTLFLALAPRALAAVLAGAALFQLRRRIAGLPEDKAVQAVKQAARWTPVWITSLAMSSLLASLAFFLTGGG